MTASDPLAFDPEKLREFARQARLPASHSSRATLAECNFLDYALAHLDAILALAEGHAAARDAALEEAAKQAAGAFTGEYAARRIRALKSGAKPHPDAPGEYPYNQRAKP